MNIHGVGGISPPVSISKLFAILIAVSMLLALFAMQGDSARAACRQTITAR